MRTNEIKPDEFREYIEEYIKRVENAFENKIKCVEVSITDETGDNDYVSHYIYHFELVGEQEIHLTQKQIEVLSEDDDSQPHNAYRIFIDNVYVYSTRCK